MKHMLRGFALALGSSALVGAFAAPANAHTTCGYRWSNYWGQWVYRCVTHSPYYRPYYQPHYGTYYRPYYGPYYGYPYYHPYGYYQPYYGRPGISLWFGF